MTTMLRWPNPEMAQFTVTGRLALRGGMFLRYNKVSIWHKDFGDDGANDGSLQYMCAPMTAAAMQVRAQISGAS